MRMLRKYRARMFKSTLLRSVVLSNPLHESVGFLFYDTYLSRAFPIVMRSGIVRGRRPDKPATYYALGTWLCSGSGPTRGHAPSILFHLLLPGLGSFDSRCPC